MKYYHGSENNFDVFDQKFNGKGNGKSMLGFGFYFTNENYEAVRYANGHKTISDLVIDGKKICQPFLNIALFEDFENEAYKNYINYVNDSCNPCTEQTDFIKSIFADEKSFDKNYISQIKRFELLKQKIAAAKEVSTFYSEKLGWVYEVEICEKNLIEDDKELTKTLKHKIEGKLYAEGFGRMRVKAKNYEELKAELKIVFSNKKNFAKFFSYFLYRCGVTGIKFNLRNNHFHILAIDRKIIKITDKKQYSC